MVSTANNMMNRTRRQAFLFGAATALLLPGCSKSADSGAASRPASVACIAASNSYIEAAVRDFLATDTPIVRLAEPGMCPGHFDLRPSQVNELRNCGLLLRFDFQSSMDAKLSDIASRGLAIRGVRVGGGMCEPASYLMVCRQVADALVESGFLERRAAGTRLQEITARVDAKAAWCRQQIKETGWAGKPVVCSSHQEAFCRSLGLEVAATFAGADATSVSDIEKAIRHGEVAKVQVVIANLPEGRRVADALAGRLGVKAVVFGNFPNMTREQASFDDLVATNVMELVKAGRN